MKHLLQVLTGLLLLAGAPRSAFALPVTQVFNFNGLGLTVPDGGGGGLANLQSVSSTIGVITDLTVSLNIVGGTAPGFTGINGDLYTYVQHSSGFAVLLNRPGMDGSNTLGYFDPGGVQASFNDLGINGNAHTYQDPPGPGAPANGVAVMGTFQPDGRNIDSQSASPTAVGTALPTALLSSFFSLNPNGSWTLFVEDMLGDGSSFTLDSWSLEITGELAATIPEPGTIVPLALLLALGLRRRMLFKSH